MKKFFFFTGGKHRTPRTILPPADRILVQTRHIDAIKAVHVHVHVHVHVRVLPCALRQNVGHIALQAQKSLRACSRAFGSPRI